MQKNTMILKAGNRNFAIKLASALIAVLVLIVTVILVSMYGIKTEKLSDSPGTEINIIHNTAPDAPAEDEYIEYEAPDTSF